jgi:glycosyltransferase involved in cell wall biosynthesis
LIEDEDLRKKTGISGYRDVQKKYSLESCYNQLEKTIQKLIN